MIQYCFRYYWISSYQTDPPADDKYNLWVKYEKNLPEGTRDQSKADKFWLE